MTTLKIGTVLIAKEDSFLKSSGKQFLIKGKEYPITVVQKKHIEIKSESHDVHEFTIGQLENYFAIKRYTLTDLKEKKIAVKIRDYKEYKRLCEAVGDEDNGEFLFLKDKYYGFDYHNDGIYSLNKGELEGRTLLESIDNIDLKEKEESKTCKYCGLTIQKGTDEEDCPNNPNLIQKLNSEIARLKEELEKSQESGRCIAEKLAVKSTTDQSDRTRMAWELYVSGFNHGIADKWTIDECFRSAEIFLSHAKSKEVKL